MKNKQLKAELLENGKFKQYSNEKFKIYKDRKRLLDYELRNLDITKENIEIIHRIENNKEYSEFITIENTGLNKRTDYYNDYDKLKNKINEFTYEEYIACKQLQNCRSMQKREIQNHLIFWIYMGYEIIFNTYTLNDETLKKYGELDVDGTYINTKKLQDKLTRLLAKNTEDYIGNVDYSPKEKRLHYHVLEAHKIGTIKEEIIGLNKFEIKYKLLEDWKKYGFTYPELVRIKNNNIFNNIDKKKLSSYLAKITAHSLKTRTNRIFIKKGTYYKDLQNSCRSRNVPLWKSINYIEKFVKVRSKFFDVDNFEQMKMIMNL